MSDFEYGCSRHKILAALMEGPANEVDLGDVIRRPSQTERSAWRKALNLLIFMRKEGWVRQAMGGWEILPPGRAAHDSVKPTPSVRVFERGGAHVQS